MITPRHTRAFLLSAEARYVKEKIYDDRLPRICAILFLSLLERDSPSHISCCNLFLIGLGVASVTYGSISHEDLKLVGDGK